jgi:hypothetical protein
MQNQQLATRKPRRIALPTVSQCGNFAPFLCDFRCQNPAFCREIDIHPSKKPGDLPGFLKLQS